MPLPALLTCKSQLHCSWRLSVSSAKRWREAQALQLQGTGERWWVPVLLLLHTPAALDQASRLCCLLRCW